MAAVAAVGADTVAIVVAVVERLSEEGKKRRNMDRGDLVRVNDDRARC